MRKPSLCAGLAMLGAALVLAMGASAATPTSPQELLKVSFKRPAVRSTLAQAVVDLGKLAEAKIVVDWQGLMDAGVKPETPVSLPATESTLGKLMDQMLAAAATKGNPLACQAIGDSLVVTTQARALRKDIRLVEGATTSRPASAAGAGAPPPAVATKAPGADAKLQFDGAPLSDVVEAIRKEFKVNIHVSYTALETSGIAQTTPVTLNASNVTGTKALDLLVEQLSGNKGKLDSVYWIVDEGVVEITTGTVLDSKMVTRTIDMGDLLQGVPDAAGPRLNTNMQTTGNGTNSNNSTSNSPFSSTNQPAVAPSVQPVREAAQNKLIAIIQKSIGDDLWQPQGKGSISFVRNTMVVSQTRLGWLLLDKANVLR